MMKLLSAEFTRLFKSFIFKLGLLFSGGLSAFCVFMRWWDVTRHPEVYESLPAAYRNADGILFLEVCISFFAVAVFIGIFVGTEYSDGTIRNKLVVGHTRTTIYLSKFIVCVCADILMCLLNIAVILILGYLLIDGTTMPIKDLLLFTATTVTALVALTSLLLLFCHVHSKQGNRFHRLSAYGTYHAACCNDYLESVTAAGIFRTVFLFR